MSHHGKSIKSLRCNPFPRRWRSGGGHRLFLLGLAVVGAVSILSLLMANLHRELFRESKDDGGGSSFRAERNVSAVQGSGWYSRRESLSPKAPIIDGTEDAGAVMDDARKVRAAGESLPAMGSEILSSSGSDRVQASHADSPVPGSRASAREDALVLRESRNESRAPDTPGGTGPDGDAASKEAELSIPLFYTLKASQFDNLPHEQQQAVVSLQDDYINYHHDWTDGSARDISEWNDRMREFHLELVRRVGAAAADALTR